MTHRRPDPISMSWVVHPARAAPGRLAIALAVLAGVGATGLLVTSSIAVAATLTAAVWGLNHEFFVPTEYRLDGEGVTLRRLWLRRHRPWKRVRRVVHVDGGLLLSPSARPRPLLDAGTGMRLRFGADPGAADAIAAFIALRRRDDEARR